MRLAALVLALAACASPTAETDPETKTVLAFRSELARIERAVTEYAVRMDKATAETCVGVRNTYGLEVRPIIEIQMPELAPALDQMITDRGGDGFADVGCITAALTAELDAHLGAECTVDDIAAEGQRHAAAVTALVDAGNARTDELLAGSAFAAAPVPCP